MHYTPSQVTQSLFTSLLIAEAVNLYSLHKPYSMVLILQFTLFHPRQLDWWDRRTHPISYSAKVASRRVTGLLNTLSWSKHNGLWYNATNQTLNTFLSPVSELSHLCMWPWILWYELSISCSENRLGNNIFLHCKFSGQEYQHKLWRQHTKCFGLVVMMIEHWAVVVMIVFVVGASLGTIHCIAWVFSLLTHLELM